MTRSLTIPTRDNNAAESGRNVPLTFEPETTALVIVDMQRFFVEGGNIFVKIEEVIDPIANLLPVVRGAGMTVVHLITAFKADMSNAGRPGSRTRAAMDYTHCGQDDGEGGLNLVHGSWTADIVPGIVPAPTDLIVTKTRFDGFYRSELDATLKARGIETLLFAGGTTNVCVESTLRSAVMHEYNPVLLTDCCGEPFGDDLQAQAIRRVQMFFGWDWTSEALIKALQAEPILAR